MLAQEVGKGGRLPRTFSSVQLFSHVQLFVTPWTAGCKASLSITNSWSLLKLMTIKSVMPSNHLILCLPLISPFWFYALDKTSTSFKVKELVLCRSEGVILCKRSVQFSCSVISDSLRPHGLQHARLPCPSPTTGACSNSCPSSWCCHPTIPSSVIPFSSCLQSFPASGPFSMSQFFESGGQNIGVSASTSVLLMNIQDWFPLGLTGLISMKSNGLSRVISNTTVQKHQFFSVQPSLWSNSHVHTWLLEKP